MNTQMDIVVIEVDGVVYVYVGPGVDMVIEG